MQPVRYFFDMVRPTLDEIEVPDLPEGLEIRPVAGRDQLRQLFDADVEAFLDHWGGFDATDAAFEQFLADPDYDPTLMVVAWDGDEIAGSVTNVINEQENAELSRLRGLLDSVSVRRPWRGRGLGYAAGHAQPGAAPRARHDERLAGRRRGEPHGRAAPL